MAENEANVVSIAGTDYDPVAADSFMNALIQSLSDETENPKEKLNG